MFLPAELGALVEGQPKGEAAASPQTALPTARNDPGRVLLALVLLKLSDAIQRAEEERTRERERKRPRVEFNLD